MVPVAALPPLTPLTLHVTALLAVFATVAVNCWVPPALSDADVGVTMTVTGLVAAGLMVTWALPDFVVSACDTATTVTTVASCN